MTSPPSYAAGLILALLIASAACRPSTPENTAASASTPDSLRLSRADYHDQLHGFWLAQCIANWTGLVTEMDKIGDVGEIKTGPFYTRDDWGQPDQPSIWSEGVPSDLSPTIDFVFRDSTEVWGADDDTDIEYLYQHLLYTHEVSVLSPKQLRAGWLTHMRPEEENYLWVSNQAAYDLMGAGVLPPLTGSPTWNEHYDMIDAQLTTEIFGLFAPGRPDVAADMARLPIQTVVRGEAEDIAQFYVHMYALSSLHADWPMSKRVKWMAEEAAATLPPNQYPARIYGYVKGLHARGLPWEATRDSIYQRYQVEQRDGYDLTSRNLYCNGCFAAGINYAASLMSLFYGEGDLKETIKIGTLAGWDSDNPTATWAGMLGFMLGRDGVEQAFGRTFSERFNIHRTRQNFEGESLRGGVDNFDAMAAKGVAVTERTVANLLGGRVDEAADAWVVPPQ